MVSFNIYTDRDKILFKLMFNPTFQHIDDEHNRHRRGGVFMVPMHGGIWTMCVDLTDEELRQLGKKGFPRVGKCLNYLAINSIEESRIDFSHETQPLHPQIRM